jgi:hypothetical protein
LKLTLDQIKLTPIMPKKKLPTRKEQLVSRAVADETIAKLVEDKVETLLEEAAATSAIAIDEKRIDDEVPMSFPQRVSGQRSESCVVLAEARSAAARQPLDTF